MIAVSDKWKEYAANGGVFHVKARLIANGRLINLTDNDFMEASVSLQDATSPDDTLAIGAVVTNTFSATLNNFEGKFNDIDLAGKTLTLLIGAEYEDNSNEYLARGIYTIEAPNSLGSTISITGYDEVEQLNKRFENIWRNPDTGQREIIQYPVMASKLVVGLVQHCNVPMYMENWKLPDFIVPKFEYEETTTIRQVVSWVLQCCGGYGRISTRTGASRFNCEWYSSPWNTTEGFDGGLMWGTAVNLNGGTMWVDADTADGGTLAPEPRDLISREISVEVNKENITITGVRAYAYGTVDNPVSHMVGQDGYVVEIRENPLIKRTNMDEVAKNIYKICGGMTFAPFNATIFGSPDIEAGEWCKVSDYLGNERITVISNFDFSIGGSGTISLGAETPELAQQDFVSETQSTINTAVKRTYDYINTEKLKADVIQGGTLTLGGEDNVNGSLKILNSAGEQIGSWDNTGAEIVGKLYMTGGSIKIETEEEEYNFIDLKTKQVTTGGEEIMRTTMETSGFYFYCRTADYGVHIGPPRGAMGSYTSGYIHVQDPDNGTADVEISANQISCNSYSSSGRTNTISLAGATGRIVCVSLTQTSKEEFKENIVPFESRGMGEKKLLKATAPTTAIDLVMGTDIYEYNYKNIEDDTKHYGVIIDGEYNCCNEIKAEDGVDTYSMVSVLWQAVKELKGELEEMKNAEANIGSNEGNAQSDSGDTKQ